MKKLVFVFMAMFAMVACNTGAAGSASDSKDSTSVDSTDTVVVDSVDSVAVDSVVVND